MPLQPRQVHLDARPQLDADHVARAPVLDRRHLVGGLEDPLGEQEPDGQLGVMAGRAHRHRDPAADPPAALVAGQADLQRLLDRQLVRLHGRVGTGDAPHQDRRRRPGRPGCRIHRSLAWSDDSRPGMAS